MNNYWKINTKSILTVIFVGFAVLWIAYPAFGYAHDQLTCWDCHLEEDILGPPVRPCLDCHASEGSHVEGFNPPAIDLLHEKAPEAPTCIACHGNHEIQNTKSPDSPVYWRNTPALCGSCHMKEEFEGVITQVLGYKESRHGKLVMGESKEWRTAVCTDCHGIHPKKNGGKDHFKLQRPEVPETCRKCHEHEYISYSTSAHGVAVLQGESDGAVCTDCHSEHKIVPPADPESPMYAANVVGTCSKCHGSAQFVSEHNLPGESLSTYKMTYHGMANKFGDLKAANCVSCHGAHDILASTDPKSRIHPDNVAKTCAQCHTGAEKWKFVGQIHQGKYGLQAETLNKVKFWYGMFVILVMLALISYISLDLLTRWRLRRKGIDKKWEEEIEKLPRVPKMYMVRMNQTERCQHYSLQLSFVILVISGIALLIPNTPFTEWVILASGGMSGRAIVHRVGAVILLGSVIYLILWQFFIPRGRLVRQEMLPGKQDFVNLFITVKFLFGFSDEPAKFGLFSFVEKFEYWTVVWGTAVMGITGAVMVFTDWSLQYLPKWFWDGCRIIHGLEATLAFLAIIIWHHYHVWWRPGTPNNSWYTGELTHEQFVHEHPLEYERAIEEVKKAKELKKKMTIERANDDRILHDDEISVESDEKD